MSDIDRLIHDFKIHGWKSNPFETMICVVTGHPEKVKELATKVMDQIPAGGTFHHAAFSYLPQEDWREIVEHALYILEGNRNHDAANAAIGYASLQCPYALHPNLGRVFRIVPNEGTYYENYPWRWAGTQNLPFLSSVIENHQTAPKERRKAWMCLLETRDPACLTYAIQQVEAIDLNIQLREVGLPETLDLNSYLHEVGFECRDGRVRQLDQELNWHILFPSGYFTGDRPLWLRRDQHPTWTGEGKAVTEAAFGGSGSAICGRCGNPLHRLLTLDPVPEHLNVSGLAKLILEVCLSCLGWEIPKMFYGHNLHGEPSCLAERSGTPPQFPAVALHASSVMLSDLGERWRWQSWGSANGRENLNRIGGHPSWIQDADYPPCVSCQKRMQFLLQLDSDLPTMDGGEWLWGSGGIGYGFWCDDCKVSAFHWQCT